MNKNIIAERLSARQLIVQCSHIASVYILYDVQEVGIGTGNARASRTSPGPNIP